MTAVKLKLLYDIQNKPSNWSLGQLTLKKGAPGDQVWDLLCVQLASYLEGGPTDVDDAPAPAHE